MSYDLYMKPKEGAFTREHFSAYFNGRKNYTLEGDSACYRNAATSVYFSFEYNCAQQNDEDSAPLAFNMNYCRPSFFVLEAEPEVRAFIGAFNLRVDDPQTHGMGTGDYNASKFINGWMYGNACGYQAILRNNPPVFTLPSTTLQTTWQWNMQKEALQNKLSDDVFVPTIMLLNIQGRVVSAVVWPDAIPSVLPPVDILLIGRRELAPQKRFKKSTEDMTIGLWADFQALLEKNKSSMLGDAYFLFYAKVPDDIKRKIQSLDAVDIQELERLGLDQVLDEELVLKHTPSH